METSVNNKCKAFTSPEQSRKLAEILPIGSADMWWAERYAGRVENYEYIMESNPVYYLSFTKPSKVNWSQDTIYDIPCWSLAALLSLLKPCDSETYTMRGTLDGGATIEFRRITNVMCQEDNPLDAVYEMVVWLKEINKI